MTESIIKVGVVKLGCIGAAPLMDLILDERADREDLAVRAFTSGAKLDPDSCSAPVADMLAWQPDLVILVSPNAALPGPSQARKQLAEAGVATVSVGDSPSKKAFFRKDEAGKQVPDVVAGQGFIILSGDPMLGARREFLDPTEMALFNADIIKLLSATGVIRLIQQTLDELINAHKAGQSPVFPALTVSADKAVAAAGFQNAYAGAKAYAALTIAESVAGVSTRACFMEKNPERYIPMVAAAHELMRTAAQLADEARELEKYNDTVLRTPHSALGVTQRKHRLADKPE